jgi:hypothetical protein
MNQGMLLFAGLSVTLSMAAFGVHMIWLGYFRPEDTVDPGFSKILGYGCLLFAVFFATVPPTWIKYEVVPPSEYTIEYAGTETVWRHDGMRISSDKKYWSDIADKRSEYCLYVSTGYNLFGMWEGDGMLSLRNNPPCEDVGKFEFGL